MILQHVLRKDSDHPDVAFSVPRMYFGNRPVTRVQSEHVRLNDHEAHYVSLSVIVNYSWSQRVTIHNKASHSVATRPYER